MKSTIFLSGALALAGASLQMAEAQTAPRDTRPDTWVATDALGRAVPLQGQRIAGAPNVGPVPAPRPKKFVGMFYFLWLGEHGRLGPFDNTEILRRDPDAMQKPDSPLWGPVNAPHHWGESVFGYYLSKDEWVLRRHAQMLSDADVDVVIFDASNQITYPRAYLALAKVWSQMRREGNKTPQIAFLTPFFGARANAVQTLYADFYQPGIARDLWFHWKGKPLILADPNSITPEALAAPSRQPVALASGETLGQSFRAERPFTSVGGSFPTWSLKDSSVTLSLYDRAGGKLLARQRFENVVNGATTSLQFPVPLPAGDYYLEQSEAKGPVGWWTVGSPILPTGSASERSGTGRAFANGEPINGHRAISVIYQGDEKPTALELAPVTTPAQREQVAREMRDFFTFRDPQPSYFIGPTKPDMWSWLEVTPQHVFKNSAGENEQMSVGVAQNAVDGKIGVLSNPRANGRSYHNGRQPEKADFTGRNFAEQWKRVFEVDPQFVFVTGWNEWVAGRKEFREDSVFHGMGPVSFVDLFNAEFSRDLEPVKGAHGDIPYYQFISYVRRFKGARAPEKVSAPRTVRIDGNFSDWNGVSPQFLDDRFDTTPRDEEGWAINSRYVNATGRNDFEALHLARDAKSVFAYARTRAAITPRGQEWMILLLDTDQSAATGWMGFDFRLNAAPVRNGQASVEKWVGGAWKTVGAAPYRVRGREMEIAVSRALLGLKNGPVALDFKWMDNVGAQRDALNLYRNGDTAPNARFKYRFAG
ncbi:MAG: hypothetical protein KY445_05635 [Armatimonadetes bacterium]|nr:hypothetical protein [Armatimonadota bacterium]